MMPPAERRARRPRRLSIESELPLLLAALLTAVVVIYATVTYRMVAEATLETAARRLDAATGQLAELAQASVGQLNSRIMRVASADLVVEYAEGRRDMDATAVQDSLSTLLAGASGARSVELWSVGGELLLATGPMAPAASTERRHDYQRYSGAADSVVAGPLRIFDDSVHSALIAPVSRNGRRAGHLVRWAKVGVSEGGSSQITELLGGNASLYLVHRSEPVMLELAGRPVPRPVTLADAVAAGEYSHDGRNVRVVRVDLAGSPWSILAEIPRREALAFTDEVFRRLAVLAFALVAVGAVLAWLLSRRITRPLREMTDVAESIATGDYAIRVTSMPSHGEMQRLVSTLNVMAEQIQLAEHQLREATHAAQAGNRAKSQFLATMSHEIRTPLNAVLGFTQLLASDVTGDGLSEKQQEYVERIRRSGYHLLTLINEVLDLARIEAGRVDVRSDVVRVADVVQDAVYLLHVQARERRQTLDVHPVDRDGPDVVFLGDPGRVTQILVNLLSNAVKFTAPDGRIYVTWENVRGTIPAGASGSWARISISDSGSGIDTSALDFIWEPFMQGEMGHTRPHGGTGLGLTISRQLARLMGGDITVESEVGVGSVFTVWLPGSASTRDPLAGVPAGVPHEPVTAS